MDDTENEIWYRQTFGRELVTFVDLYRMGRFQFNQGEFGKAIQCLERYIACTPQIEVAAMHMLGHAHRSLFFKLHQMEVPSGPQTRNLCYVAGGQGDDEVDTEALQKALECFVAAVRLGFDDDWQMVVETKAEIDSLFSAEGKQLNINEP